jgi:hypothetical protein
MKTQTYVLLSACVLGCSGPSPSPISARDQSGLEALAIIQRVSKLEVELDALKFRVAQLEKSDAYLSTEEEHYALAHTKAGAFIVVCKGVTPYLDGFKARLAIANITSGIFVGAKLKLGWGRGYEVYLDGGPKQREITVTNTFYPGVYARVDVALTPATPEDVKRIRVGIEPDQVQMREQ